MSEAEIFGVAGGVGMVVDLPLRIPLVKVSSVLPEVYGSGVSFIFLAFLCFECRAPILICFVGIRPYWDRTTSASRTC